MNGTEKEIFIQFLKDNEFYEGWMEGYNIDNEIYSDNVPLGNFFEKWQLLTKSTQI